MEGLQKRKDSVVEQNRRSNGRWNSGLTRTGNAT
jgi:hypothetical protein